MEQFYVFLIQWDIPIYFISGIGILVSLVQLGRGQNLLRTAMFSLEREQGYQLRNSSLGFLLFFTLVTAAVLYTNVQIAPTLPDTRLRLPTPTPNLFATPLSSPTPLGEQASEGGTPPPETIELAPTVTLPSGVVPPVPAGTAAPATTPTPSAVTGGGDGFIPAGGGCTPAVSISQPRPNTAVFGTVEFYGTASSDDFGFYLLEIQGDATSSTWVNILGEETVQQVSNGLLGAANLGSLPNGNYQVRLTLLDNSGGRVGQCVIDLVLSNE